MSHCFKQEIIWKNELIGMKVIVQKLEACIYMKINIIEILHASKFVQHKSNSTETTTIKTFETYRKYACISKIFYNIFFATYSQ